MIRDCTEEDLDSIVAMSQEFWVHTIFKDEVFYVDDWKSLLRETMRQGLCLVLEVKGKVVGFICGVVGSLLANFKVALGTELAWWVNESERGSGEGLKLLDAIELRAKELGIKYWNMAYMESSMPGSIKKIYESKGYTLNESHYTKVI